MHACYVVLLLLSSFRGMSFYGERMMNRIKYIAFSLFSLVSLPAIANATPYYVSIEPLTHSEASAVGDNQVALTDIHGVAKSDTHATVMAFNRYEGKGHPTEVYGAGKETYSSFSYLGGNNYDLIVGSYNDKGDISSDIFSFRMKPGEAHVIHVNGQDYIVTPGAWNKI